MRSFGLKLKDNVISSIESQKWFTELFPLLQIFLLAAPSLPENDVKICLRESVCSTKNKKNHLRKKPRMFGSKITSHCFLSFPLSF
jgi:hypothetical protein